MLNLDEFFSLLDKSEYEKAENLLLGCFNSAKNRRISQIELINQFRDPFQNLINAYLGKAGVSSTGVSKAENIKTENYDTWSAVPGIRRFIP